ncbi:ABC transporter substrate-binding protein [Devosia sp. LjRoot16]|uniref:ABC transporter substrate-binding protein n=1 Tax=Devosia sp. LjRoot16 TaxID=3342271 RepID=UPI003ECFCDDB
MRLRTLRSALVLTTTLFAPMLALPALAQTGKTISGGFDVGPGGFPGNFNPLAATAGLTWLSVYYEPLVIYNADLTAIVGDLAESFEISADQKTYSFKLTSESWHDGEAFTAADVKFTLEAAKSGDTGSVFAARLGAIESIATPDDRTVVLTLSAPNAGLLDTLTKIMMLPEHALGKVPPADLAKSTWWSTTPVGTGAFKFEKYVTDQYVEVVADEDYRGGRPAVDKLINRYFENSAAAVAALRAGEIQFTYVEADDVATFSGNDQFKVIEGPSFVVNYVGFNQEVPFWKDLKVRQAVMHAIDRKAIIESLYNGAATEANCGYVADQFVPDGIEPYAYDPEKAKALLAEAGWAEINGDKPITILTYYNNPLSTNVLAAIQAMLAQVGINIVPRAVDSPTYNATVLAAEPNFADFPLIYAGLQDGPEPSNINVGLNETMIPPAGTNALRIRMPEVSAAFDAALGETDATKRDARYQAVCQAMNANLPWATMWVANRYGVASTSLEHFVWTPAPGGGPFDADPEKWDLANAQ